MATDGELGGHRDNGRDDSESTIAMRPYPALKLFRDAMYAALKDKLTPDVWDYQSHSDHDGSFRFDQCFSGGDNMTT